MAPAYEISTQEASKCLNCLGRRSVLTWGFSRITPQGTQR